MRVCLCVRECLFCFNSLSIEKKKFSYASEISSDVSC